MLLMRERAALLPFVIIVVVVVVVFGRVALADVRSTGDVITFEGLRRSQR